MVAANQALSGEKQMLYEPLGGGVLSPSMALVLETTASNDCDMALAKTTSPIKQMTKEYTTKVRRLRIGIDLFDADVPPHSFFNRTLRDYIVNGGIVAQNGW